MISVLCADSFNQEEIREKNRTKGTDRTLKSPKFNIRLGTRWTAVLKLHLVHNFEEYCAGICSSFEWSFKGTNNMLVTLTSTTSRVKIACYLTVHFLLNLFWTFFAQHKLEPLCYCCSGIRRYGMTISEYRLSFYSLVSPLYIGDFPVGQFDFYDTVLSTRHSLQIFFFILLPFLLERRWKITWSWARGLIPCLSDSDKRFTVVRFEKGSGPTSPPRRSNEGGGWVPV